MAATLLPLLLLGQAVAATPPAPSTQPLDAVARAMDDNDCDKAIDLLAALEKQEAARTDALFAAAVAARKGICLIRLGRDEAGEPLVRRALPLLETGGEAYLEEVRTAHWTLGQRAAARLDYAAAQDHGRSALAVSTGGERLLPLALLVQVSAFDPGDEPLAYADEALALVRADSERGKRNMAAMRTLRGRVLMNQGRHREAYAELKKALAHLGGLTRKASQSDIATRADLAVAAMLNGNRDAARTYLAYTGAGRMEYAMFDKAEYLNPPACGVAGLKPEDFAVVEFSIGDDGSVSNVTPVYTTGGRAVALEFAQAVSQWSWRPADVKDIPAFFRDITRVELRCSLAADRQLDLMAPLAEATLRWLSQLDGTPAAAARSAKRTQAPMVVAALQRERAAGNRAAMIGLLSWLGDNRLIPDGERAGYLDEAIALASSHGAPQAVRTYLALRRVDAIPWWSDQHRLQQERLQMLLADPQVQADAISLSTVRLRTVAPRHLKPDAPGAEALLQAIVADQRLAARHPLKVAALLRIADLLARRGDIAGAQQAFAQTGLTEEQCALLGVEPAVRQSGASSSDYPAAALNLGFEGWLRAEFDIAADGRTARPRITAAYPPFIFNEAATGIIGATRYESSYRPEGGTACSANSTPVYFRIPR